MKVIYYPCVLFLTAVVNVSLALALNGVQTVKWKEVVAFILRKNEPNFSPLDSQTVVWFVCVFVYCKCLKSTITKRFILSQLYSICCCQLIFSDWYAALVGAIAHFFVWLFLRVLSSCFLFSLHPWIVCALYTIFVPSTYWS